MAAVPKNVVQVVKVCDAVGHRAKLLRYRRKGGIWQQVGKAWDVSIGRNGLGKEREGDGKTPVGIFPLEDVYGYHDLPTSMPFFRSTPETICVDDSHSRYYNRIVETSMVKQDYESFEKMRRGDGLYEMVVTVGYNKERVPMRGSCIFLHIANGTAPTAGCIAMKRDQMRSLVEWLDPAAHPVLVVISDR